jgi:OTU-like cysteine protease
MYSNVYDTNNGFTLRHLDNDHIRDNLSKVVWPTPLICESFAEAIAREGFSTSEYYTLMAKNTSWGGMIEICAVAELFHVNIEVLVSNADRLRRFKWMGSFKYSLNDAHTTSLYILYSGNNYYESLIDTVADNDIINDLSEGRQIICQLSSLNDVASSEIMRLSQTCDVERVKIFSAKSRRDLQGLLKSNDVLDVTETLNTTLAHTRKKRECRSTQDFTTKSPQLKNGK